MEMIGTLPVALKKLVGQTEVKSKKVSMKAMTAIEYVEAQAKAQPNQYLVLVDLANMTYLIDDDGKAHDITYEMLAHSSRSNLEYLQILKQDLDAKEQAESL